MRIEYLNEMKCAQLGLRIRIEGLTLFFRNWIAFKSEISLILHIYFSFFRLQFKFNHLCTAFMSDFMGFRTGCSRKDEFDRIIYYNVRLLLISLRLVSKLVDQKNTMSNDAVDLTKCLFSQLPIFTQFPISYVRTKKNEKLGTSWTWVCSLAVLATSLRAFLSILCCYYPFYLFIFIDLFSGFNLIFT